MAIISTWEYAAFDASEPDDFRRNSRWALIVDPSRPDGAHGTLGDGDDVVLEPRKITVAQADVAEVGRSDERVERGDLPRRSRRRAGEAETPR